MSKKMFANLLKTLMGHEAEDLAPSDARVAIAALLVRVARSDSDYAMTEIAKIDRVLAARYGLKPSESQTLRAEGEALEKEAPDTVRFTRAIKDAVPYVDRVSVIEALWQIALADGERDAEEDALLRLVANLLGVSDVESAAARKRVSTS